MQTKGTKGQTIFWQCLNKLIAANDMPKLNFKGFICNNAEAKFNGISTDNGSGDVSITMVDRKEYAFGNSHAQTCR